MSYEKGMDKLHGLLLKYLSSAALYVSMICMFLGGYRTSLYSWLGSNIFRHVTKEMLIVLIKGDAWSIKGVGEEQAVKVVSLFRDSKSGIFFWFKIIHNAEGKKDNMECYVYVKNR